MFQRYYAKIICICFILNSMFSLQKQEMFMIETLISRECLFHFVNKRKNKIYCDSKMLGKNKCIN